jgi:hypothetical protein
MEKWGDLRTYMNKFYWEGLEELWVWLIETHTGPPIRLIPFKNSA